MYLTPKWRRRKSSRLECSDFAKNCDSRSEAVKDFSIPIEQLETPQERYQRVVILYRKPNQISKNMLNRYFKLWVSGKEFYV